MSISESKKRDVLVFVKSIGAELLDLFIDKKTTKVRVRCINGHIFESTC
jgi:hypothetical protein